MRIFTIHHPIHGDYYVYFDNGLWGVTKTPGLKTIHCAYAKLWVMLQQKDL